MHHHCPNPIYLIQSMDDPYSIWIHSIELNKFDYSCAFLWSRIGITLPALLSSLDHAHTWSADRTDIFDLTIRLWGAAGAPFAVTVLILLHILQLWLMQAASLDLHIFLRFPTCKCLISLAVCRIVNPSLFANSPSLAWSHIGHTSLEEWWWYNMNQQKTRDFYTSFSLSELLPTWLFSTAE